MMEQKAEPKTEPWHLDRRVPVALILAIAIQSATAIWWASKIDSRVADLETYRSDNKEAASRLAVLESQVADVKEILRRIEQQLIDTRSQP